MDKVTTAASQGRYSHRSGSLRPPVSTGKACIQPNQHRQGLYTDKSHTITVKARPTASASNTQRANGTMPAACASDNSIRRQPATCIRRISQHRHNTATAQAANQE
ncbi:MAG: hypothetical protein K0U66_02540 [Gammaproteobacteria bacterium]|nr:hypothetical protein [Gammaproteobacteria bacterium]